MPTVLEDHIKQLTEEMEKLYEREDLQQHPYDLQAVIMHDGLMGRNHIYTYTKDVNGRWWKVVDYQVTEVSRYYSAHSAFHSKIFLI